MHHYSQKYSGHKTGLNSSKAVTMSVRPCPISLKVFCKGKILHTKILLLHILPRHKSYVDSTLTKLQHICHDTLMEAISTHSFDR